MKSGAMSWELQGRKPEMKWWHWIVATLIFGSIPFADTIGNLLYAMVTK